jgi:hypothetical protein
MFTGRERGTLPPDLVPVAERLGAEIEAIEAAGDEDACRLCQRREQLTEEHTPSKKAGNSQAVLKGSIDYEQTVKSGVLSWGEPTLQQGGASELSLCGKCNNETGSWYNPEYVRFARRCAGFATPQNAGSVCAVDVTIRPQRVAKQALTTIIAASNPGITGRYPQVGRLLLDRHDRSPLAPLRLGLFLRANAAGRGTGITMSLNMERRSGRLLTEFSFWPLGWVLSFDGEPVDGTLDVSKWVEYGYHERIALKAEIPCQWAIWMYPGDFRPPEAFTGTS